MINIAVIGSGRMAHVRTKAFYPPQMLAKFAVLLLGVWFVQKFLQRNMVVIILQIIIKR